MPTWRSRAYASSADLGRIELALADAYLTTSMRVGDLSWLSREHTHRELSLYVRLWEDDAGQLIAWTFLRPNGEFNAFVVPQSGRSEEAALLDELLRAVEEAARASIAAGDPPVDLVTYGVNVSRSAEDRAIAAALDRFGYQIDQAATATSGVMTRALEHMPEPAAPDGYHLDQVRTPDHVIGRVDAHRRAFAMSELSVRKYQRVQRTWAYRPSLDRIALSGDENVVAFCTAWLDEKNAAGLLEPVGTHPAHQRRGLARAVCNDALRALYAAGARQAQVGFGTQVAYATYLSLGFTRTSAEVVFHKSLAD